MFQPLGMDIFVSNLPAMISQLRFSESQIQYILVAFVFASGLPQLFIGHLADKYGRRPLMLFATIGFSISSYFCITTHQLYLLTVFRFIQGLCASASIVISYAVIRDSFSGKESAKKYSQLSCVLAMTPMLAPLLGTILVDIFHHWQATFWFLVLFSLIASFIAFNFLPETKHPLKTKKASLSYFCAIKKILNNRHFLTFSMSATTTMTGLFLYFSIGSIILLDRLHVNSYDYSLLFAVNAISYLSANYIASQLVRKINIPKLVFVGNLFVAVGASLMIYLTIMMGLNITVFVLTNIIITIGGGLMTGPATSAALEPFTEETGMASGVFGSLQYGIPAMLGFLVTRFEIHSLTNLAIPMLLLSLLNILLIHQTTKRTYAFI
jgi:DHA1 family bicyclomycin/chloramphenicol resistance-like MFS transporter